MGNKPHDIAGNNDGKDQANHKIIFPIGYFLHPLNRHSAEKQVDSHDKNDYSGESTDDMRKGIDILCSHPECFPDEGKVSHHP